MDSMLTDAPGCAAARSVEHLSEGLLACYTSYDSYGYSQACKSNASPASIKGCCKQKQKNDLIREVL